MMSLARTYSLLIGLAFVGAGVAGFIPHFVTMPETPTPDMVMDAHYAYLLGVFPVNVFHTWFL